MKPIHPRVPPPSCLLFHKKKKVFFFPPTRSDEIKSDAYYNKNFF